MEWNERYHLMLVRVENWLLCKYYDNANEMKWNEMQVVKFSTKNYVLTFLSSSSNLHLFNLSIYRRTIEMKWNVMEWNAMKWNELLFFPSLSWSWFWKECRIKVSMLIFKINRKGSIPFTLAHFLLSSFEPSSHPIGS